MTHEEVLELLNRSGALLSGHYELSSGRHADRYCQCALAFRDPRDAGRLGKALAMKLAGLGVDLVAGPALGGILVAHEVARALGTPCVFSERSGEAMTLRRGFRFEKGQRILAVEDVITTGKSVMELVGLIHESGARLAGIACIVDRSGGHSAVPEPPTSLVALDIPSWSPTECPLCRAGEGPAIKPGSRPKKGP